MGFFGSKSGKGGNEQSPNDNPEITDSRRPRTLPSTIRNSRRSSGTLSRNGSGRSVSCSAKTVKVGSGLRIFGDSGKTTMTATNSSRGQSLNMHQSIDRLRSIYKSDSVRSFVSDLDLESAEMTPIGEGSQEFETNRIAGIGPLHDTEGTSSELYPSADFTLASESNINCGNSKYSSANGTSNSKGSKPRSVRSSVMGSLMVDDHDDGNSSSAEFHDTLSISGQSVMMDKSRAENVGRSGTKYVYIVLLVTGIIVTVMINLAAQKYEENNFELEFRSFARETADLAETNADHTFSQLQTMATTVTSEGLLERERIRAHNLNLDDNYDDYGTLGSWPNVSIPHFDKRIEDFSQSFGAIMLLYVPLVEAKDKESWTQYANEQSPWKSSVTSIRNDNNALNHNASAPSGNLTGSLSSTIGDDMVHDVINHDLVSHHANTDGYVEIHPCPHLHIDDTRDGFFDVADFEEEVLTDIGGFENPQGLSAPVYQYGGPGHERKQESNSDVALMDVLTHPIFKKDVIASIEYDLPVISEYMDVGFIMDGLSTPDPGGEDASYLWLSPSSVYYNQENNDVNSNKQPNLAMDSIRSLTLHPVKESFESGARTIGFIVGVVPWHAFFQNVLSSSKAITNNGTEYESREVDGIVVVVTSDCDSVFTFVLNSSKNKTSLAHLGDWKDHYEKYDYLNQSSRFFWKDHAEGESKYCNFELHIYPNDDFRDMFRANSAYYSAFVAGIFLFTALLFALYDHFIFKGQQHIVHEATGMIVQNARRAAKNERDLNDFIAHEVRNPLAAAISACAFVSSAITEDQGRFNTANAKNGEGGEEERLALLASNEKRKEVEDDINIIDSSLHFINDLLRNMLDMQRAGSNQIFFERKPTNIMDDIFKPVEAMMHLRDVSFKVIIEVDSGLLSPHDEDNEQLVVMTDSMRLKQVMLNLTRNATKFVEKGFIRISACVNPINGFVELRVDDSGPGIPPEKRNRVFGKFQQSLDSLQQGTGIGLSLCKKMVEMMGGSLFIDEDYNSGVEGCRGTRFVIQLNIPPLQLHKMMFEPEMPVHDRARLRRLHLLACTENSDSEDSKLVQSLTDSDDNLEITFEDEGESNTPFTETPPAIDEAMEDEDEEDKKQGSTMLPLPTALKLAPTGDAVSNDPSPDASNDLKTSPGKITELPKTLSVLFVDDDMVLRKLFSRTLKKINPTWSVKEASSGETAIELITSRSNIGDEFEDEVNEKKEDDCGFDLIFMDQYMASVQKQLLGTETVRKIRAKGFQKPIICGLSANDVEDAFFHAGSDAFMFKPFPCKKDELQKELLKVINSRARRRSLRK